MCLVWAGCDVDDVQVHAGVINKIIIRRIFQHTFVHKTGPLLWLEWNSYLINIMGNTCDYSASCY